MSYVSEVNRLIRELAPEMDLTVYDASEQEARGLSPEAAAAELIKEAEEMDAWAAANPPMDPEDYDYEPDAERIALDRAWNASF